MPQRPQDFSTHRRWFPLYHFIVQPLLILNIWFAADRAWHDPSRWNVWVVVMAFTLAALAVAARIMALKVQNRLIRLEMRLRLAAQLPPELARAAERIPTRLLIALRFAGDAELQQLVECCLNGKYTTPDEVKRAVTDWQPDWMRA